MATLPSPLTIIFHEKKPVAGPETGEERFTVQTKAHRRLADPVFTRFQYPCIVPLDVENMKPSYGRPQHDGARTLVVRSNARHAREHTSEKLASAWWF